MSLLPAVENTLCFSENIDLTVCNLVIAHAGTVRLKCVSADQKHWCVRISVHDLLSGRMHVKSIFKKGPFYLCEDEFKLK